MSARDVIARAIGSLRRHKTNSAVATLPSELAQADDVVRELTAASFSIVHKDEIHAPSVERAIAVVASYGAIPGYPDGKSGAFRKHRHLIAAALRELMKEVG